MRSKKSNIVGIGVIALLMILTFFFLLKDSELTSIVNVIKNIDINYFILGILMVLVYLVVGGYYLQIILKSLGVKIGISRAFFYMCTDFYFSAITPSSTGGQPAEIYYMAKDGVPPLMSTMSILLISAIYKIVIIILGIVFIFYNPSFVLEHGLFFKLTYFLGLFINILICIFCFMLMFSPILMQRIVSWCISFLGKIKIVKKPEDMTIKFHKMLDDYKRSADYLKTHKFIIFKVLFYAFIQRMALFAVPYFIYRSFGYSDVGIIDFILVQTGVSLAIDSLPLPGGIGASEVLFLNLYSGVYNEAILMPAMLLTRGVNYYFCLLLTAVVVLVNHVRIINGSSKKKSKS